MFRQPVRTVTGETVVREGFVFADLRLPAVEEVTLR
jgi:hypothetical protein